MRSRVLVEHTDSTTGIALARALHDAGFAVATCSGPTHDEPCPVLRGEECSLAACADAIVCVLRDHPEGTSVASWLGVHHPRTPLLRNVEPGTVVRDVQAALGARGGKSAVFGQRGRQLFEDRTHGHSASSSVMVARQ